jgi:hypothetical protein
VSAQRLGRGRGSWRNRTKEQNRQNNRDLNQLIQVYIHSQGVLSCLLFSLVSQEYTKFKSVQNMCHALLNLKRAATAMH